MKHRKCKRALCAVLCAVMVASTMCTASFAADGPPAGESSTSSSTLEPPGSSASSETETLLGESGVPETEESLSADTQQILDANVQKAPAEGNKSETTQPTEAPDFPELPSSSEVPESMEPTESAEPAEPAISLWMDTTSTYTFQSVGKSYQLMIRTTPVTTPQIESSDSSIVRVETPVWNEADQAFYCKLFSEGEGDAVITVQAGDAVQTLPVRVVVPATRLTSDTASYTFGTRGQTYMALFFTQPDTRPAISSSDPSVVSVSTPVWDANSGGYLCTFTAGAEGEATVTAQAGTSTCEIPVTVSYAVVAITRDTYAYTFGTRGQTYTVYAETNPDYRPIFESSNPSAVSVGAVRRSGNGYLCTLTALENGTASVSITAGKTTVTIPVTVSIPHATVSLDTSSYAFFYPGQKYTLLIRTTSNAPLLVRAQDASVVGFTTRPGERAGETLVDLTAKKNGSTQIQVSIGDAEASMPVTVQFIPITVSINTNAVTLSAPGKTYTAIIRTTRNLRPAVATSDNRIARVDSVTWDAESNGYLARIRATGVGSTTIVVTAATTRKTFSVTVKNPEPSLPTAQLAMWRKAQSYSSNTGYLLMVNLSTRHVGVFTGKQGNWSLKYYWQCTVGAPSTPTVTGEFVTQDKGYYFDSGASRCFYWTRFYGGYLFHSTLYYQNFRFEPMNSTLGAALSHGCVRLQINNAKWIYDNIPRGTKVVSYR